MAKKSGAISADLRPVKVGGKSFQKKPVTLPVLKMTEDQPVYVKITSAFRDGRASNKPGKDGEVMKPARICDVVDLESNEPAQMIAGKVLESNLVETYPGEAYVGKSFEIIQRAKADKQRYRLYTVSELQPEA